MALFFTLAGTAFESCPRPSSMSYADLHLDAKTAIARTSIAAWNALMRADPIFGRYALSGMGRSMFLATFTVVGDGEWRIAGKLHRIGGPARTSANYGTEWYERGRLHRIGGPAATYATGNIAWYEHGKLHRVDGPAITYVTGKEVWYEKGIIHRIGGPAIAHADGHGLWFEYGEHRQPPCSP